MTVYGRGGGPGKSAPSLSVPANVRSDVVIECSSYVPLRADFLRPELLQGMHFYFLFDI